MPPPATVSDSVDFPVGDEESTMELELPGEEKKNRRDAKAAEKSGVEAPVSDSEEEA